MFARQDGCICCGDFADRILCENYYFYAIYDAYPVNPGHLLLITKRHVPDMFGLSIVEFTVLQEMVAEAKKLLDREYQPGGYNLGANCGMVAGQEIMHFHLHVIPRYVGDVAELRGGICHLKEPLVPVPPV